ncbi:MAG: tetratricopeptide repeat protein [Bacteroidetes bacterium]|nr:tetratricopeptide repeat protein [Bacteroidota bacterium]
MSTQYGITNDVGELRVFVTCDGREMQSELDLLARDVFPSLAKICETRGLGFTLVNLRRGVQRTFAHQAKLLRLSLDELQRNRPYVIGLLGARYGWASSRPVPPADATLLDPHTRVLPLIAQKRSMLDIEISEGVLASDELKERSFFYFRDGDRDDVQDESDRLDDLKSRIRESGVRVREDFPTPDSFAARVHDDLLGVINRLVPEGVSLTPLELERRSHETFAASRRHTYVPKAEVLERLEEHIAAEGTPLVITGASGAGKSALVAYWSAEYRRRHPDAFVITHYVGAVSSSGTRAELLRRVMMEVRERLGEGEDLPAGIEELEEAFPIWLAKAAAIGMLLIVDGIGQLGEGARDLEWLPNYIPPGVRLIVTSVDVPFRARQEKWPQLHLEPLSVNERIAIGQHYITEHHATVPADRVMRVAVDDSSSNPLFLRTRLEEIRLFGSFERRGRNLEGYLAAESLDELFDQVLERLEDRFGTGLLGHMLCAIWCARYGMSERELERSAGCSPLELAELLGALDYHLLRSDGRLRFYHDALRRAVERRYLNSDTARRDFHSRMAHFFGEEEPGRRRAEELPWQFQNAGDREAMKSCIASPDVLLPLIREERGYELLGYWLEADASESVVPAYMEAVEEYERSGPDRRELVAVLSAAGEFLRLCAHFDEALTLLRRAAALQEELHGGEHIETAHVFYELAHILQDRGDVDEAELCYRRALAVQEALLGTEHPTTARTIGSLAGVLREKGEYDAAEHLYRTALTIVERSPGNDPYLADAINNLAGILHDKGQYDEAEMLFRRALSVCESIYGPDHPNTAITLNNLAALLCDSGDGAGAVEAFSRVAASMERTLGAEHPMVASVLCNWAGFLAKGNPTLALPLMKRALAIHERAHAEANGETAIIVYSIGRIYYYAGNLDSAERYLRRAYDLQCAILGQGHPDAAVTLSGLAMVYRDRNELWVAERLLRRAIEMLESSFGESHPQVGIQLGNLAELARRRGDVHSSRLLGRKALSILAKMEEAGHAKAAEVQALLHDLDGAVGGE